MSEEIRRFVAGEKITGTKWGQRRGEKR